MLTAVHGLLYARDADRTRAFFRDVLGWDHVDAGEGWLIFAAPPAELGVHPTGVGPASGTFELYLVCDDVHATVAALKKKGVRILRPVTDQGWGLVTAIDVPGAGEMGLYQPRHPLAAKVPRARGGASKSRKPKASRKPASRKRKAPASRRRRRSRT